MTTSNFVKFSTVRPGIRHGAIVEVPQQEVLAAGSFRALSASTFELTLGSGEASVLAIVHGSLCTPVQAGQDVLSTLVPGAPAPKKFARLSAIKAAVRYGKYLELTDPVVKAKGTFRFLDPGTLELTFDNGTTNLILIARGYLYALEKPLTDVLTGLIGATIGTTEEAEETPAAPLDPPMAAAQQK